MTTGQRIAQKRKEQSLSQEALGEALGISRQAIYKWESDATLPEIEKLIALSRIFGVSVGWLLGVEADAAPRAEGTDEPAPSETELTEVQLRMVEEIAAKYAAAQRETKPVLGKWDLPVLFALCGILIALCVSANSRMGQLEQRYTDLQDAMDSMTSSASTSSAVNEQSATYQVEQLLRQQNSLTTDYDVEIQSANLKTNRVTFSIYTAPKTYVEGMSAEFYADYGDDEAISSVRILQQDESFSASLSCPLTDSIVISVVFTYPDGREETQILDGLFRLHQNSFPTDLYVQDFALAFQAVKEDGTTTFQKPYAALANYPGADYGLNINAQVGCSSFVDRRVGLFRNQELVFWLEPCDKPANFNGFEESEFFQMPTPSVTVSEGDTLCLAAVVADEFGRVRIFPGTSYHVGREDLYGSCLLPPEGSESRSPENPADWIY